MKRMDQIDPNFRLPGSVPADTQFLDPQKPPFSLWGLAEKRDGAYCRLPASFLPECNPGVQELAWHLAGACVRFSTDADHLSVLWALRSTGNMPHFAASGQSGMQLFAQPDPCDERWSRLPGKTKRPSGPPRQAAQLCAVSAALQWPA